MLRASAAWAYVGLPLRLGGVLSWALAKGQRLQQDYGALVQNLLQLLDEDATIRPKVRPLLISSYFFSHLLRELRRSGKRRIKAIRVLALIDGVDVVPHLLSQLTADDAQVREEAVDALAALREERALDLLLSLWQDYPSDLVAEALVRRGPGSIPKVGPLVTHPNPLVRLWAGEVLKRLKAPEGAPFLADAMRDSQVVVRAGAAYALGEVGAQDLGPLVTAVCMDPAPEVRVQAAESLLKIGHSEGRAALQEAFLALGEQYLPWDATLQLWKTFRRCLGQMGGLEECLRRTSSLPPAAFQRWVSVGATAGDIETLVLTLHYVPAYSQEVMASLERVAVTYGEEPLLQQLVKALDSPPVHRLAALKALAGLSFSSPGVTRLSAELMPLLEDPQEEVRSYARLILRRSGFPIVDEPGEPQAVPAPSPNGNGTGLNGGHPQSNGTETKQPNGTEAKMHAVLVDNNVLFRQGLGSLLQQQGILLSGETGTIEAAERVLPHLPSGAILFCFTGLPNSSMFLKRLAQDHAATHVVPIVEAPVKGVSLQKSNEELAPFLTREATKESVLRVIQRVCGGACEEPANGSHRNSVARAGAGMSGNGGHRS